MLLLDTHVMLWFIRGEELGEPVRRRIADPDERVFVSVVSHWELSIKEALGRLKPPESYVERLAADGFETLRLEVSHARAVKDLPQHHRDPFDRMLVVQARAERMTLVSRDRRFRDYDVDLLEA